MFVINGFFCVGVGLIVVVNVPVNFGLGLTCVGGGDVGIFGFGVCVDV